MFERRKTPAWGAGVARGDLARTSERTDPSHTPAPTTKQVVILIEPVDRRDRFAARLDVRLLVKSSRTPFLDAARALIALGFHPDSTLVMRHTGSEVDALRARLGTAAGLTVEDCPGGSKPPRFVRYRPRDRVEGSARTATDLPEAAE
jgi:hypothetical protein